MTDPGPAALIRSRADTEPAGVSQNGAADPGPLALSPIDRMVVVIHGHAGGCIWFHGSGANTGPVASTDGGLAQLVQAMAAHSGDQPGPDAIASAQAAPSDNQHLAAGLH